jgi:hypothetical protein
MNHQSIIDATRRWIASIVIELNLCPFAQRVFEANTIRYIVSDAQDETSLLRQLAQELKNLAAAPISTVETTLLIHPHVLLNFMDYNEFLGPAEQLIEDLGLEGAVQIASFHPEYQFADTDPDAVENYTNRSPYPMLHLLREESITAIAASPDELLEIPHRNIDTLRRLGLEKVLEVLKGNSEL